LKSAEGKSAEVQKEQSCFAEVQKRLATNRVNQKDDNEPRPIRFLRIFSNYLTPKLGIFSGDTWASVGIYLRNTILNLTVVLLLLATVLALQKIRNETKVKGSQG
jgi:hypothetical protein